MARLLPTPFPHTHTLPALGLAWMWASPVSPHLPLSGPPCIPLPSRGLGTFKGSKSNLRSRPFVPAPARSRHQLPASKVSMSKSQLSNFSQQACSPSRVPIPATVSFTLPDSHKPEIQVHYPSSCQAHQLFLLAQHPWRPYPPPCPSILPRAPAQVIVTTCLDPCTAS